MNWENQYLEEDPREREQYLWVSIFYFMMKGCRDDYGLEGERVMRQAVRDFGLERALRKRQRADAAGMPPDLITMSSIKDIYSDPRFSKPCGHERFNISEPDHSFMKVYTCPNNDMWAVLEGKKSGEYLEIGSIYCEEVHHYLYGKFDPAIQMNLCEILTKGDECCNFRIHLRKANQRPYSAGEYHPQRWEDFGDNEVSSIHSMFALHLYHYAKAVYDAFGEEALRKILRAWANERGCRLREQNRRRGAANDLIPLVEQSDLFLDQRIQKTIHTLTPTQAEIRVDRSIVGEMMEDHGAPHLGRIYRDEVYKAICESYNPDIQVTVIQEDGSSRHTLRMTLA